MILTNYFDHEYCATKWVFNGKVGIQGTSREFEQKLHQSSASNQHAVVEPAPTTGNKKVPTKFTVTPAMEY